jgi:tetratricopeptide (TPR) repeat protein
VKKQVILASFGALLVLFLYVGLRTTSNQKPVANTTPQNPQSLDIQSFISESKKELPTTQLDILSILEKDLSSPDANALTGVANFWRDSARKFLPYAYYLSQAAKLDNSEKSLTFAAQLILSNLRVEHDGAKIEWLSTEAISLFEKAIILNPENDDLRVGLGSCYVFGKGRNGDPQQTMKGIQELLAVVRKDSTNMKAQLVLGAGGYISGQYDKAISRLNKVVEAEPGNLEAVAFLADANAASGKNTEAIKWYQISKRLADNPAYTKEVDERIKLLENKK